jgi:hypothetical protein
LDYVITLDFEPVFAWNELGQLRLWLRTGRDSAYAERDKGDDEKLHDCGECHLRDSDMMAEIQ